MDKLDMDLVKENIAPRFRLEGTLTEAVPYGSGHINDTVRLTCELENGKTRRYILQRMNDDIFKNPKGLMENIMNVTSFLRNKNHPERRGSRQGDSECYPHCGRGQLSRG